MPRGDATLAGYRGHVDAVGPTLAGWVSEIDHPSRPVVFVVSIDGEQRLAAVADGLRADVAAAGLAAPRCGFAVALPAPVIDGAEHRIRLLLPDGRPLNL